MQCNGLFSQIYIILIIFLLQGDSGGSAAYKNELIGVANFVVFGCGSNNPDGYASIPFFIDWINKTIEKN